MIKGTHKSVAVVVVFTGYKDGTVDFSQYAPYKNNFKTVKKCLQEMRRFLGETLKNKEKCPYNPDNPLPYATTDGNNITMSEAIGVLTPGSE